jgi:phage shock protein A
MAARRVKPVKGEPKEVVMGIVARVIRLCKADMHAVMDQMEDKDLLLRQHLREMEAALADRQAGIDRLEESLRAGRRDLVRFENQLQGLEADLERAVARNKDAIARMLIRKRFPLRETVKNLAHQLNAMAEKLAAEQERLDAQGRAYDETRHRVAATRERRRGAEPLPHWGLAAGTPPSVPSEEEIEWELLQCKEAAASGRAS